MFQSIASMLERVSKAIIFHSNNPNWFFHASAELGWLGGKNRWWRWQLSEPLIEQSTLLNFYLPPTDSTLGLRGSRDDKGRMVGKPTREWAPSCFLLSGERGALTTSISFSFQPTNGKIMLQIAIRLFFISSNLIESFFTSRTSPHCRSRPNSIWPSLEQCVSRSISSVINQTYREISTCWQKLFTQHDWRRWWWVENETNERGGKRKQTIKVTFDCFCQFLLYSAFFGVVDASARHFRHGNVIWLRQTRKNRRTFSHVYSPLLFHLSHFPFQMNMWHVSVGDELHRFGGGEFIISIFGMRSNPVERMNWSQLNPNHF